MMIQIYVAAFAILAVMVQVVIAGLWWAYCLSILWAWFAVPIWGLPAMGVWQLFATKLLLSGLMPHGATPKETDGWAMSTSRSIFVPPLFLLVGWFAKQFI